MTGRGASARKRHGVRGPDPSVCRDCGEPATHKITTHVFRLDDLDHKVTQADYYVCSAHATVVSEGLGRPAWRIRP